MDKLFTIIVITVLISSCVNNNQNQHHTSTPCQEIRHELASTNPSLRTSSPERSAAYRSQLIRAYKHYDCSNSTNIIIKNNQQSSALSR